MVARTAHFWRRSGDVARTALAHRVPAMAGESAFFAALAVFPALLMVVAVVRAAGPLLGAGADAEAAQGMTSVLRLVLTTRGSAAADAAGALLVESSRGLLTVGPALALLVMVRAFRSVLHGLSVVSRRPPRRSWPASLGLATVTLVGAAVVVAAAVQDPLLVAGLPGASAAWRVLRWPVVAAALLGWAYLLLRVGLGSMPTRRRVAGGAVTATAGWVGATMLFPLYVAAATRVSPTFGALGGGLVLLVWLYLLMLALLVGGVVASPTERSALR